MMPTSDTDELAQAVRDAATRPEVLRGVEDLYAELMRRIDVRRPRCDASGRCCRFEEFGHRLYVTTAELATFVHRLASAGVPDAAPGRAGALPVVGQGGACPYQVEGLCSVHAIRPFGCRVFFCDETAAGWQQDQYEQLHGELKRLHDRLGIAYFYVEWRQALGRLGLARS